MKIEFDTPEDAVETFFQKGWTDGLPVIPPTEGKVLKFLGAAGLAPDEILGAIPERNRVFTAEKVAVNAVMAGCLPEYFPVVVAAVRGISRPEFGLHGVSASTAGSGILMVGQRSHIKRTWDQQRPKSHGARQSGPTPPSEGL